MKDTSQQLVQTTAETLRQRIFESEPGTRIGTLRELARDFDVGIVTIQQVARILELEGLLEVRRGPSGGYFGRRPDIETLEGLLSVYMRSQPSSWEEALDMTSLLFIELCAAAAGGKLTPSVREDMSDLAERIEQCKPESDLAVLEEELQNLLFSVVDRPLFELLTRVTLHLLSSNLADIISNGIISPHAWRTGRVRILKAIIAGDVDLARFEADRSNRQLILKSLE